MAKDRSEGAMKLVDACRSPIRREIMILAEEARIAGTFVTAKELGERLERNLGAVAYHVKELAKAEALKAVGGTQRRGAWQKNYIPSESFQATMTDTVALDKIAEVAEEGISFAENQARLFEIIRATGRPVGA